MSALALVINIPLMVIAFALTTGVPLWMVLRRPDHHPKENRSVPAYLVARHRAAVPQQGTHWLRAGSCGVAAT